MPPRLYVFSVTIPDDPCPIYTRKRFLILLLDTNIYRHNNITLIANIGIIEELFVVSI